MVVRGSPAWPTRRASAGTSTTTTRVAVLRDIPGLVVGCPARGDDAAAMLRTWWPPPSWTARCRCSWSRSRSITPGTCTHRATTAGSAATAAEPCAIGSTRSYGDDQQSDLVMVTFGNGVPMSLRVAERLRSAGVHVAGAGPPLAGAAPGRRDHGRRARPPGGSRWWTRRDTPAASVRACSARWSSTASQVRWLRVASRDSFVPLGTAAQHVLLGEDEIEKAAADLAGRERR